jgi:hypothetical protein
MLIVHLINSVNMNISINFSFFSKNVTININYKVKK